MDDSFIPETEIKFKHEYRTIKLSFILLWIAGFIMFSGSVTLALLHNENVIYLNEGVSLLVIMFGLIGFFISFMSVIGILTDEDLYLTVTNKKFKVKKVVYVGQNSSYDINVLINNKVYEIEISNVFNLEKHRQEYREYKKLEEKYNEENN